MVYLFSAEWLLESLTKDASHYALLAAFFLLYVFMWRGSATTQNVRNRSIVLAVATALEVYAQVTHHGKALWLFNSFEDFLLGVVVMYGAFLMMTAQVGLTKALLQDVAMMGGFETRFSKLLEGLVVLGVAMLVCLFLGEVWAVIAVCAYLLYALCIICYPLYSAIRNHGNAGLALYSVVIYLVGLIGICVMLYHFIVPTLIALVLKGTAESHDYCNDCLYFKQGQCIKDNSGRTNVSKSDHACREYKYDMYGIRFK